MMMVMMMINDDAYEDDELCKDANKDDWKQIRHDIDVVFCKT